MSPEQQGPEQDIILKKDGDPFATEQAAQGAISSKNIDMDRYGICTYPKGSKTWAIIKKDSVLWPGRKPAEIQEASSEEADPTHPGQAEPEKFFKVRFHERYDKNQTVDVFLACNGEVRQIKRNEIVIIPERFREIADHGEVPQFTQLPGESRKRIGALKTYPYDFIEESTEGEYLAMLAEGTRINEEAYERSANAAQ